MNLRFHQGAERAPQIVLCLLGGGRISLKMPSVPETPFDV